MQVNKSSQNETVILGLQGRVDSSNASLFESLLFEAIQDQPAQLMLNLEQLEYISSAGLRVLLKLAKHQRKVQQQFAICSLSSEINELFEITGFNNIIDIHDDQDSSLRRLNSSNE